MPVVVDEEYVRAHFLHFCEHDRPAFFNLISPSVHWRVMGSIPTLSGTYYSLADYQTQGFSRAGARLDGRMTLTLTNCIVSGRQAVVEMSVNVDSVRQKNGKLLPNEHCWIVHYDESGVIDSVRMWMDGVLMQQLMTENPGP